MNDIENTKAEQTEQTDVKVYEPVKKKVAAKKVYGPKKAASPLAEESKLVAIVGTAEQIKKALGL